jgi:ABC-type Mn2+/Zn2+ transport system ATPase subunit
VSSAKSDLRGLGFSYGARPVLRNVDAAIGDRSRVAVVGPNGVGKSSLLRLVAGLEEPESGTVAVRPMGATIAFLPRAPWLTNAFTESHSPVLADVGKDASCSTAGSRRCDA